MSKKRTIGVSIVAIVLLALGFHYLTDFLAIDSCLDLGGAWDYEKSQCTKDSLMHPVLPYISRFPFIFIAGLSAMVVGVFLASSKRNPKNGV